MTLHIRRSIAVTLALAGVAAMGQKIQATTGARLTRYSVIYSAINPTPTVTNAIASATRQGVFVMGTATAGQHAIIAIPGFKDDFLMTSGPGYGILIDQSKAEIGALIAELVSGKYCNRFGYVLTTCESAFLQLRG
jgi:hypothetical protein